MYTVLTLLQGPPAKPIRRMGKLEVSEVQCPWNDHQKISYGWLGQQCHPARQKRKWNWSPLWHLCVVAVFRCWLLWSWTGRCRTAWQLTGGKSGCNLSTTHSRRGIEAHSMRQYFLYVYVYTTGSFSHSSVTHGATAKRPLTDTNFLHYSAEFSRLANE